MRSKSNRGNFKKPMVKPKEVKAVVVKNEVTPIFFLEGADESFLGIEKFPYGKLPLPEVGESVNLSAYGDFEFDYFIVKEKFYRYFFEDGALCAHIYFTVSGEFGPSDEEPITEEADMITIDPENPTVGVIPEGSPIEISK